jgi:hypothetical protein
MVGDFSDCEECGDLLVAGPQPGVFQSRLGELEERHRDLFGVRRTEFEGVENGRKGRGSKRGYRS